MRTVPVLLVVLAAVSFAIPAAAENPEAAVADDAPPTGAGRPLPPSTGAGLTGVHGGLTAGGAKAAGRARDVALPPAPSGGRPLRPMATPRVLRRLESARVVDSLSPSLRACANDGALTAPASFALTVAVGPDGSVESAEVARDARLPSTVVACVVKAVTAARFGAPGVAGATAILPVTVPARAAAPATPAPMTTAVAVGSSASQAATPRAELHAVVAAAVVSTNP